MGSGVQTQACGYRGLWEQHKVQSIPGWDSASKARSWALVMWKYQEKGPPEPKGYPR